MYIVNYKQYITEQRMYKNITNIQRKHHDKETKLNISVYHSPLNDSDPRHWAGGSW